MDWNAPAVLWLVVALVRPIRDTAHIGAVKMQIDLLRCRVCEEVRGHLCNHFMSISAPGMSWGSGD